MTQSQSLQSVAQNPPGGRLARGRTEGAHGRVNKFQSRPFRACVRFGSALALLASTASTMAVTIAFSGTGLVTGPAQVFPVLSGLTMQSATSNYTLEGDSNWHFDKLFGFNVITLVGEGVFTLSNGSSSLSGTFTSSKINASAPTDLAYTVTDGSGLFAGYAGSGVATGVTVGNAFALPAAVVTFTESGSFNLAPVAAVPEPANVVLLATGLTGIALWRRRSRAVGTH